MTTPLATFGAPIDHQEPGQRTGNDRLAPNVARAVVIARR